MKNIFYFIELLKIEYNVKNDIFYLKQIYIKYVFLISFLFDF